MSRVTVLGGAGVVGGICVRTLVRTGAFAEVRVADANYEKAWRLAEAMGGGAAGLSAVSVDATDPRSVREAVKGSAVVVNCVGPFYRFARPILAAVCEAGVNYVDICDDFDATEQLLAMDGRAREAGILALIGMGSSPGLANVFVRFCADFLLDPGGTEAVDIYHAHGGEKEEGRAVVAHRIHSMLADIPVFLEGEFRTVRLFEESGRALEEVVELPEVGACAVYAYPHPETITLPRYIQGVRRVTNLGTVLPPAYAELIKGLVRLGVTGEEPVDVGGRQVVPREFAISYALAQRPRLLREAGLDEPVGCLKIVMRGTRGGERLTYAISLSSRGQGMGEATGIPAALGAILVAQGKIAGRGVLPPEACVNPLDILELADQVLAAEQLRGLPVTIQRIPETGPVQTMDLMSVLGALGRPPGGRKNA